MVTKPDGPDRIAELLEAYGSDLSRWPEDGRLALAALSPEERAARLREDVAFDKLIAGVVREAEQAAPSDALMARIMAAAANAPAAVDEQRDVVELRSARSAGTINSAPDKHRNRDWTAAAALLAASLVLGILVGSTEQGQSTAIGIGNIAGLNVTPSPVQTTALDEVLQPQDDEDIL